MVSRYTFSVACFAAIGSFLFGFDTGIATTTIAHQSWVDFMDHPSNGLTGAVVAVYIAGETVGGLLQTALGDKLGRLWFMEMMCIIVSVGTSVQAASTGLTMFLIGRAIAGIAVGGLICMVPIYLSEIASPSSRGLIGSFSGVGISVGTMASNFVGFACGFAPYGQLQWRWPLGIQVPWGVILFVGLITFMPNSPRQLLRTGKAPAARIAFLKVRGDLDEEEREAEWALMRAQIEYETQQKHSFTEIFRLYRHRALVSIAVQCMTSLTGVNVIQYYQTILYRSLNLSTHTIFLLVAIYGVICFIANLITTLYLADSWGRRPMILTGLAGIVLIEIYTAVMQHLFEGSHNDVGKGFTILGIFLFGATMFGFLNSTSWLYAAEVLPLPIRSKVMGVGAACHFIINVGLTEAGPSAFANIRENYYYVFVACTTVFFFIALKWFPETRGRTLEEIKRAFGEDDTGIMVGPIKVDTNQEERAIGDVKPSQRQRENDQRKAKNRLSASSMGPF